MRKFNLFFISMFFLISGGCDIFYGGGCISENPTDRYAEPCINLPENAVWNTADRIDQVFDGEWYGWTPSEYGSYNEEPSTTECRFICKKGFEYSGGICTDENMGGLWSDASRYYEQMGFESAVKHCEDLEERGFADWRLPSISELRNLIRNCQYTESKGECKVTEYCTDLFCFDDSCYGCEEGGEYSRIGATGTFWSTTPADDYSMWAVDFNIGGLKKGGISDKDSHPIDYLDVICIRNKTGNERRFPCGGLPEHGMWNSAESIVQIWDGTQWVPSAEGTYNEEPSEKECRFKCDEGYVSGDAGICVLKKMSEKWSDVSKATMSWDDASVYCGTLDEKGYSEWRMPTISELRDLIINCPRLEKDCNVYENDEGYSNMPSCYGCYDGNAYSALGDRSHLWSSTILTDDYYEGFAWTVDFEDASIDPLKKNDASVFVRCTKNEIEYFPGKMIHKKCKGLLPYARWNYTDEVVQIWNGSAWVPSDKGVYNEEYSMDECRFECIDGYFWNDEECIPDDLAGRWSKRTPEALPFEKAVEYCEDLEERNHFDWRLPAISELRSLVINCQSSITGGECGVTGDCLMAECAGIQCSGCEKSGDGIYSLIADSDNVWSSSKVAEAAGNVWYVSFSDGSISFADSADSFNYARCIR